MAEIIFKDRAAKKFWDYNIEMCSQNPFGKEAIKFATQWAKNMEKYMLKGSRLEEIIAVAAVSAGIHNISKEMYTNVLLLLVNTWIYGEQLRQYHNKKCGYEGEGIANPGMLVIP